MKTKKGELTSNQLITIIILIISFAIILAFILMLGLRTTIDKEACRNSVIMRGVLPFGKDAVKLKCKSQDVCLSIGGECNVERKDMITVKVDNEKELTEEMVNLLWDCWWMMGEGKIDYMSSEIGLKEAFCSICYKVYFDDKIQTEYFKGLDYKKVYEYMENNKVPDRDETYVFSFYKVNSMDPVQKAFLERGYDIYNYKLDPKKEYVVMTAMSEGGWGEAYGGGIGLAASSIPGILAGVKIGGALGSFGGPIGTAVGAGIGAGGAFLGIWIGSMTDEYQHLAPEYVEFRKQELDKAFNCKEYVSEI